MNGVQGDTLSCAMQDTLVAFRIRMHYTNVKD